MIPLFASFSLCLFIGLEQGIIIGAAVSLAMLLYSTARPRVLIEQQSVSLISLIELIEVIISIER